MHMFHVMGYAPDDLPTIVGAIREMGEHCRLVHAPDEYMKDFETNDYTGELLDAPVGVYYLWQGKVGQPLLISLDNEGNGRKIMLGKHVLLRVDDQSDEEITRLPDEVIDSFRKLLKTSQKSVWVYMNQDKDLKYDLRWPDDAPAHVHPLNRDYKLVGWLDLKQGKVIQA